jgi:hypothetical protein
MLDHLVYGAPDLDSAIVEIESLVGVRPATGGRHAGGLTHNALLSLGEGSYLEVISPAAGADLTASLPFGLATLSEPRLAAWAIAVDDLESRIEAAKRDGYDPGPISDGSRELPDGSSLKWRLAFKTPPPADGLAPFLIQWLTEPHPSATAPQGCRLAGLRAEHPDPASVEVILYAIGVKLEVARGSEPRLIASLDTPNGRVELS